MPLRRRTLLTGAATLAGAALLPSPAHAAETGELIEIGSTVTGRGIPLVGYNTGHYLPGSNTSEWLAYSRVNAVRFFATLSEWAPTDAFDPGTGIGDVATFDERKAALRAGSEAYIDWARLEDVWENHVYENTNFYRLDYQVSELHRLGITTIMEAAELAWNKPWSGLWVQWQKHYAFTYHLARHWDVERYSFINEPDHPSAAGDIVNQQVYIRGLQIMSDAVRCAIADVNARYGKKLRAIVHAPVVTHVSGTQGNDHMDADPDADARDDQYGWGQICMMNVRTDYHGETVDYDIFDVFDTHKYNTTAGTYAYEIEMARQRMAQYSPVGTPLPLVYSEFNRRNTGAFETSGDSLDTALVYQELADIWSAAAAGQADGMIAFKFQNTMRSNGIPYGTGCYRVENTGTCDITGVTKAGEVNRLFAKGFAGTDKVLLSAAVPIGRTGLVSHDPQARRYYIWLPRPSGTEAGSVTLDLRQLSLRPHAQIAVEEVSPLHNGGIVALLDVPHSRRVTLNQPAGSVWLVTVADDVRGGERTSECADQEIALGEAEADLEFRVSGPRPRRATLELDLSTEDGAPLGLTVYAGRRPLGQLTATSGLVRVDVTEAETWSLRVVRTDLARSVRMARSALQLRY